MTTLRRLSTVLRLSTISSYRAPRAFFSRQTVAFRLVAAILLVAALLVHLFPVTQTARAAASASMLLPPGLGEYPNMTVALSGDVTVTPDAVPTGATSINVLTSTSFKGTFTADPVTGLVRVTNAHPAGAYSVTVQASDSGGSEASSSPGGPATTRTFTLTVLQGSACGDDSFFTNAVDVSGGVTPDSVAVGDFNNDGKQDLAAANVYSHNVSIRLGDGLGGFSDTTNIIVGDAPYSVAIGDFNNDGKQDLATANYVSNNVSIRLGDGLGGFNGTTNVSLGTGTHPYSVAIGDFNNDGKQDFATANYGSFNVSIRLGDGKGGFNGSTNVSLGTNPVSVAIGDFNNDGNQDFATANFWSNDVSIRLGDGVGGFSDTKNISVGDAPESVAIGDFNNDGKQDFATANSGSGDVSIRLGNGSGAFSGMKNISVGDAPYSVAIGDFNNDGKHDLATANYWSSNVSIRLGDGLGGFNGTTNVSVGTSPVSVAIGDFNNDGKQDFATASDGSENVSIRLGYCGQKIIFGALSDKIYGDADFNIRATASSGLPVSFRASGNCTVSANLVHLTGAGECTITASQAGDSNYLPAPDVQQTFRIFKAASTTTVICLTKVTYTGSPLTPCSANVTGAAGLNQELTVDYTRNINAGTANASASFPGDANYTGSSSDLLKFMIDKASQTITFDALPKKTLGDPDFDVSAKASSGLKVTFAASGINCSISGSTVQLIGVGSCSIGAFQLGDSNYNAAPIVPQTFSIDATPRK